MPKPRHTVGAQSPTNESTEGDPTDPAPSTSGFQSPSQPVTRLDHSYVTTESPRTLKRKMSDIITRAERVKKQLKYTRAQVRRLQRKVASLQEVVTDLRKKDMITIQCETVLEKKI